MVAEPAVVQADNTEAADFEMVVVLAAVAVHLPAVHNSSAAVAVHIAADIAAVQAEEFAADKVVDMIVDTVAGIAANELVQERPVQQVHIAVLAVASCLALTPRWQVDSTHSVQSLQASHRILVRCSHEQRSRHCDDRIRNLDSDCNDSRSCGNSYDGDTTNVCLLMQRLALLADKTA